MTQVSVRQARAALSALIERARAGEEIVITRQGTPVVRLAVVEGRLPQRRAGALKGLFEMPDSFFDPLPEDILDAFYNGPIFPDEDEVRSSD